LLLSVVVVVELLLHQQLVLLRQRLRQRQRRLEQERRRLEQNLLSVRRRRRDRE
jgi:cell division protein ZapA (FtsZ GTPase activity inhibitor)